MKTVSILIMLVYFPASFRAQTLNAPVRFTHYTIKDGLPSNIATSFMQDSRGFVWISTNEGLVRFDGSRFSVYQHNSADSNSMPYYNTGTCIEMANSNLLFVTGAKLWMLNPFNHRQYAPPVFWRDKTITELSYLNKNLFAIKTETTTYFCNMKMQVVDSLNTPFRYFGKIVYTGGEIVMFDNLHNKKAYSLKEKKTITWNINERAFQNDDGVGIMAADTVKRIVYLCNYFSGIFSISCDSLFKQNSTPQKQINLSGSMLITNMGDTIVSAETVLMLAQKGKPRYMFPNEVGKAVNLPGGSGKLFEDRSGYIWLSGHNGISRFKINQSTSEYWKLPYTTSLVFDSEISGIILMHSETKGSLYFNISTKSLHIIDSNKITYCWGVVPVRDQFYIYGNSIKGRYAIPSNNIKLLAYDTRTKKISAPSFLKPCYHDAELITMIYESRNGNAWYSLNRGNGLVRQKAGDTALKQYRNSDNPRPFGFRYVNKAAEDGEGNIYFSSNKQSNILLWKNKEQAFEEWEASKLLHVSNKTFGAVQEHFIDNKQNLWIYFEATGLMRFNLKEKKGEFFEAADGLPSIDIIHMVADANNNIWLSSARGLACLMAGSHKFLLFTAQDGLPFTDFYESSIFYCKEDSSLYFANTGYLFRINTNELLRRKQKTAASLFIDKMEVNNHEYYFANSNSIFLKAEENNLQFSFAILDLENSITSTTIEYCLTKNGNKPFWQKMKATDILTFSQLNPGGYRLQVRMLNDATNNYIYANNDFYFTIATPWNKSWWFILSVIGFVIMVSGLLIRSYYLQKIEKQQALNRERNRIAADLHDDLGAGLSRIRYMSTGMKNEIKEEGLKKEFEKIISSSDELVDNMNEIIWALNNTDEKLEDVLYYIRSQCSEMMDNAGISLETIMPDTIPVRTLKSEEKRNIYLLVKEAMHNIIKHAETKKATLNIVHNKTLNIHIHDYGKGFNVADNEKKGNGLRNLKKRVAALNAKYRVTSSAKGTFIQFEIPL